MLSILLDNIICILKHCMGYVSEIFDKDHKICMKKKTHTKKKQLKIECCTTFYSDSMWQSVFLKHSNEYVYFIYLFIYLKFIKLYLTKLLEYLFHNIRNAKEYVVFCEMH